MANDPNRDLIRALKENTAAMHDVARIAMALNKNLVVATREQIAFNALAKVPAEPKASVKIPNVIRELQSYCTMCMQQRCVLNTVTSSSCVCCRGNHKYLTENKETKS